MRAWPLFDLAVATPELRLRLPRDEELDTLAARAAGRVIGPEQAAWMGPWAQLPSPAFERNFVQYHWAQRGNWTPAAWSLQLGIFPAGEAAPAGVMGVEATEFAHTRTATTGSWLLPEWRGRGLGKAARAAMLTLLFDGLGARRARSAAHPDNAASHGVSRALGYREDGTETIASGAGDVEHTRLVLPRAAWTPRGDHAITGLDACRGLFGLDQTGP